MTDTPFSRQFHLDPARVQLKDYPTDIDNSFELPCLETSLDLIGEHQRRLWANGKHALLLVLHGTDASGKDSLIRTLATYADPAGFHAWSFSRPDALEARHDFLWRTVPMLPALGQMVAFNRSYHEAVMAERLWPVRAPEHYNWPARYDAIRSFESHLVQEGTTIVKIWLHLSDEEHRHRLLKRLDKPRKRWKFESSDIDAWRRRHEYRAVAGEAMAATHTTAAPWHIIPANRKPVARALVARIVAEQLQGLAPEYPSHDPALLAQYAEALKAKD
ncbi:polyphosphate kinase 2 family protein [Marinobacter xestospongiae]|uniref:Polyphosphate kinase n=1 Tax=Marinobacter xestospongiae TaxID=994319 RepID=A0ABU3VX36_9GAMM|nr:polyphosphate kinase [Marinobacter xestospongiae]MCK7568639.1 polyphosphate kinase [Marinobacter xestospongiae]MDV2078837.1 polyphosphate kinase [Marinobacter xestospongiae]